MNRHDSDAGGHLKFFTSWLPISLRSSNSSREGRSATFAFEGTYENQTSIPSAAPPARARGRRGPAAPLHVRPTAWTSRAVGRYT